MRTSLKVLLAALAVLSVSAASASAATDPLVRVQSTKGMYNQRYCEYLGVKSGANGLVADVWNTYGLNKCPAKQWAATDIAAVKEQLGAAVIKMNGPRYWIIERASITFDKHVFPLAGDVQSFGGLQMRFLTTVDVPTINGKIGIPAYYEATVNRTTHFVFGRKHPVHELIAPSGKVYAMQAYSQIVDKKLTEAKLTGLRKKLKLPAGWRYRTVRIKKDMTLKTVGATIVVQDEFQNTYQLVK